MDFFKNLNQQTIASKITKTLVGVIAASFIVSIISVMVVVDGALKEIVN